MFTPFVLEILLFKGRSILSLTQRVTEIVLDFERKKKKMFGFPREQQV